MKTGIRKIFAVMLLSSLLTAAIHSKSEAQTKSAPLPATGEACTRADKKTGIVVEDACGRKACALKFGQKVPKMESGLTKRVGCEWKLIDNRCECEVSPSAKKAK